MEYLAEIILGIVASITTIITVILQRKQDKITDKIDESNDLLKHKRDIEQEAKIIDIKHQSVIDKILLTILDISINISKKVGINVSDSMKNEVDKDVDILKELSKKAAELDNKYSVLIALSK